MSFTTLAMAAVGNAEDELIDSTGTPDTVAFPGTQAPPPTEVRPTGLGIESFYLPDPNIGGKPAPGKINGANVGNPSWPQSHQAPNGVIGWFPPIENPAQGNVGRSRLAARQYAGVMDQLAAYNPSQLESAAALVGINLDER